MKNNLLILVINFLIFGLYAQDNPSFYIEIPNESFLPEISHDANGNPIGTTNTGILKLDELINSYEIYNNQRVFENSTRSSLQNIYLIECNDIELMHHLYENYSQFYPRVEDAYAEPLLIPNDLGTNGGYTGTDQEELFYIRANEAWDLTTGSSDIIIGIPDPQNFQINHEDLNGTIDVLFGNNDPIGTQHGTIVSSIAAANTNNNLGMSSIGYNSYVYGAKGTSNILNLSNESDVRILSLSYGSGISTPPTITPPVFEEIIEDNGDIVIAAAGNGNPNSTDYYRPASYKGVIAVSAIGHQNESFGDVQLFKDTFEYKVGEITKSTQYNDSIDIVAPGIGILVATGLTYADNARGTSISAPMVAGTVALMLDLNYCLENKEVETILKLTAVVIDTLPQNIQFYGKLGAGKLDAYEAVKMAKDMKDPFGTVEVKNRILYRPWFYKLETAPYKIKMFNNLVTDGAKLKFRARSSIEILSGLYHPQDGYIDLQINPNLSSNCPDPGNFKNTKLKEDSFNNSELKYNIYPTLIENNVTVQEISSNNMSIVRIFDFFNQLVYERKNIKEQEIKLNIENLKEGIYIMIIYNAQNEILFTTKVVKK